MNECSEHIIKKTHHPELVSAHPPLMDPLDELYVLPQFALLYELPQFALYDENVKRLNSLDSDDDVRRQFELYDEIDKHPNSLDSDDDVRRQFELYDEVDTLVNNQDSDDDALRQLELYDELYACSAQANDCLTNYMSHDELDCYDSLFSVTSLVSNNFLGDPVAELFRKIERPVLHALTEVNLKACVDVGSIGPFGCHERCFASPRASSGLQARRSRGSREWERT